MSITMMTMIDGRLNSIGSLTGSDFNASLAEVHGCWVWSMNVRDLAQRPTQNSTKLNPNQGRTSLLMMNAAEEMTIGMMMRTIMMVMVPMMKQSHLLNGPIVC
jgi:hypothetical protein